MRRISILVVLVAAITLVGVGLRPNAASAAILPKILPNCDQTMYIIQNRTSTTPTCVPDTMVGCERITPEQYAALSIDTQNAYKPLTTTVDKSCGLNDFVQLFINLASWGLAILAILGVLMVVWGGFTMLTALGDENKIKEGKATLWGAILGTTIVLSAWLIINFYVSALTGTGPFLFYGTSNERKFSGSSACEKAFHSCAANSLALSCRDDLSNNNAVTTAQGILAQLGCYDDSIDGCFGVHTEAAVKNFQFNNNGCTLSDGSTTLTMPSITAGDMSGRIDDTTWAFLHAAADGGLSEVCPQATPSEPSPDGTPTNPTQTIKVRGCISKLY